MGSGMGSSGKSRRKNLDLHPQCDFVNADFVDDLRLYRRLKRRQIMSKSYQTMSRNNTGSGVHPPYDNDVASVQEVLVDEEYQEFLNCVLGLQDEIDEDYSTFFDKLKEEGNTFVFELMFNGEVCKVRYEMENYSSVKRQKNTRCGTRKDVGVFETLRSHSTRDRVQTLDHVIDLMDLGVSRRGRRQRTGNAGEGIERLDMTRFEQIVQRSKGKFSTTNGVKTQTKKNNLGGKNVSRRKEKRSVVARIEYWDNQHKFHPNNRPAASVKKSKGKVFVKRGMRTRVNKIPLHGKNVAEKKDKRSNNRPAASMRHSSKFQTEINEGYSDSGEVSLMDLFEIDCRNNMILKPEGVNPVRDDETPEHSSYSESSSDSEIVVMASDPYSHGNTPFIAQKSVCVDLTVDEEGIWPWHNDDSQFRKGLMETLEAPYDEEEYKDRMLEVSRKRNKERERELRSGRTKAFPLHNTFCVSYLDQYSDLNEKIKQFSEPHNALFLLRGFFYWLEHSPLEKSFMPWLDPSSLGMLRRQ